MGCQPVKGYFMLSVRETRLLYVRSYLHLFVKLFLRIHQQHFYRGERHPRECPRNDIKQSDGEAPASEIWGMWSTPSLPLLPCPLWPGVLASDRVLYMSQIEQTMRKQMIDVKLWLLFNKTWNHLTIYKKLLRFVKRCYIQNVFTIHIFDMHV